MKTLLTLLAILGCSSAATYAQTLTQKLTSGAWPLLSLGIDADGDGATERTLSKPCLAGTSITFSADGTGAFYRGPDPCEKGKANPEPFTWTLAGNTLTLGLESGAETVVIKQATATALTLHFTKSKALFKFQRPGGGN